MAMEAANDFSNVRILVVDDHESMRLIISTLLRAFGFTTISEAVNGDDALRMTPIFEPDLVITDLRMPVRDGMALVQSLRQDADSRFQNVPVIMVTGHASESVIRNAIAVGVNQFLAKPITGRSLAERIRRAAA
jgi:CheY-like chemotaxis protein